MYRLAFAAFIGGSFFYLAVEGPADGQDTKDVNPKKPPVKFAAFLEHVKEASYDKYKNVEGFQVESQAAFEKMRDFVTDRHKNYIVKHTFLSKHGHAIDCVPINHQPALRHAWLAGHKVHLTPTTPPDVKLNGDKKAPGAVEHARMVLAKGEKDADGNEMAAPEGTIPIRRVTLDDVARFKTLKDFLQKHPSGSGHPLEPAVTGTHRYAVGFQNIANVGGTSWLNIWHPAPPTNEFSLSQVWYSAGSPVQTIEAGWQVYPQKYGHNQPVLFIYWTADGYDKTGNYNLDAPAFVQINSSFVIGGAWNTISTTDGTQYGFGVSWYRDPTNNNWWLWVQAGGANTAIGYYPSSLYGKGPMASGATTCEFGGEVTGLTSGPMGSGAFASAGFGKAAFQKNIFYYPTTNTATQATLSKIERDPSCYTIDLHNSSGTDWGSYFYFGGPKCP